MELNYTQLEKLTKKYGDSVYLLNSETFENNFKSLKGCLKSYYEGFNISYSFKTNYTPALIKKVLKNGGYAEVVSKMEYYLAKKCGFKDEKIILNGPKKDYLTVKKLLLGGGQVNVDSEYELDYIKRINNEIKNKKINVAIRCNFDIGDNVLSRFGFDVESESFTNAINYLNSLENVNLVGLHCHFATRRLEPFSVRAEKMIELIEKYFNGEINYLSLGGGLFGKMPESLKSQFSAQVPSYDEYAKVIGEPIQKYLKNRKVQVFIEAGTAVVGDAMSFLCKVIDIKNIRGKNIAIVSGSKFNVNPTGSGVNLPLTVYSDNVNQTEYKELDFGGYTCIESDYIYKNYNGPLKKGDYLVFDNAGSYSVVLKPPFILPNVAMIDISGEKEKLVKRKEESSDIFKTFKF